MNGILWVVEMRKEKRFASWRIANILYSHREAKTEMRELKTIDKNSGESGKYRYRVAKYERTAIEN